ncbi:hypothetical protein DNTS_017514, partial [Danionella cerebrum]
GLFTGVSNFDIVHPIRVDSLGHFLSNLTSHRVSRIHRRETGKNSRESLSQVFYHLQYGGQELHFNLTLNPHLLSPGFLTERRYGGLEGSVLHSNGRSLCYFLGDVWSTALKSGQAAVSTCDGLTGLFKLSGEEFFISPLEQKQEETAPRPHAIYKRHAIQSEHHLLQPLFGEHMTNTTCGVIGGAEQVERQRERWERRQLRRRIRQRSISTEKWVETLVVADPKMVEYHGSKGVVSYVLSVMNIVAGLFRDASIGNAINIAVVRLILLEKDEEDLKITHHADNSLNSFCKWQKGMNMKDDDHPVHHDVAVLITRKDICAAINKPCETLGLSHVAGMCQPHRSCSINEDTGLPLAFTIAHELGHNFGIQHDGDGNDCEPIGKRPFVMSPQLLYGTSPPNWSRCSRKYITRFLDRGWGWCLDDPPGRNELETGSPLPGVLYSAAHQCKLQYGSSSLLCDDVDNICSTLWCTVGSTCHSRLDGAVDGTKPKYGGKYCLGERRRYRTCNHEPCLVDQPSFRHIQCSHFNAIPYKGKFYKWTHVNNRINPCELHCRPMNEHFSERMLDTVIDGTQCYEGTQNRDICVNGICKYIGCDFEIDSDAVEDQCGVCHGNGSTCETVRKTFENSEGFGYVDIGLIPEGARDIRIEEVAEAGNYLALRSNDPDKYFLNGGWTIQWNGEYKAAGTVFTYERTGQLENLSSPGPTMEPVWIQLLFQETNPGVMYEYTISRDPLVDPSNGTVGSYFQWIYGTLTECSATCGTGVQRQVVLCVERMSGIVEDRYCDSSNRPDDKQTKCNKGSCPAVWWAGDWQKCTSSCGDLGLRKRTVLCIQSLALDEQQALQPEECQHLPKPESITQCNVNVSCPSDWTTGSWSECSVSCASGLHIRDVSCSWNTGVDCDPKTMPNSTMPCHPQDCPANLDTFGGDLSGSGSSSQEVFNEINIIPHENHFDPSKNQPRVNDNRNTIIEDDFSQVDDFYYDYNFIKFHEDLANDLDKDEKVFDNSGINHGHVTGNVTSIPTSSPLTTADQHSLPSDSKTRQAGVHEPQQKSLDVKNEGLFAEDYFLPVFTTTKPLSGIPRLFNKYKPLDLAHKLKQEITTTENLPSSIDVSPEDKNSRSYQTVPAFAFSSEPTTNSNSHDYNNRNQEWQTEISEEDHELKFKEDGAALDSLPPPTSNPNNGHLLDYVFQTYEEKHAHESTTPPQWNVVSQTGSTSNQLDHGGFSESTNNAWPEPREFTVISFTLSQKPASSPTSPIPAKQYSSMTSAAGTTALPPTEMTRDLEPPTFTPVDIFQATTKADINNWYSTAVSVAKRNQPRVNPGVTLVPQPIWTENDYNEDFVSKTLKHSGLKPTLSTPTQGSSSTAHSVQRIWTPSPSKFSANWKKGNWSTCSTSCGLGAIWRSVYCSTGNESHCDIATRPVPARRCYLRPCSAWKIGEWSKCSKNCGIGVKVREVQCQDTRDQRLLRPFHCQATSLRPPAQIYCSIHNCSDWFTSSWGQCSEVCGGGEQQRLVTCPETGRCDENVEPPSIQACNVHPCNQWITGSWGQCSVSCGGGIQRRLVKCVNTRAELEDESEHVDCDYVPRPKNTKKCNVHDCDSVSTGQTCLRDQLTLRFCQSLQWLGRCDLRWKFVFFWLFDVMLLSAVSLTQMQSVTRRDYDSHYCIWGVNIKEFISFPLSQGMNELIT